jgi:hypothetical protein
VRFWGLASREVTEVLELFGTEEEAEQALAEVLTDEPEWRDLLFIVVVELAAPLSGPALN